MKFNVDWRFQEGDNVDRWEEEERQEQQEQQEQQEGWQQQEGWGEWVAIGEDGAAAAEEVWLIDKVTAFIQVTGVDDDQAWAYMQKYDFDEDAAASAYFDSGCKKIPHSSAAGRKGAERGIQGGQDADSSVSFEFNPISFLQLRAEPLSSLPGVYK
jgi:hypothetical protein